VQKCEALEIGGRRVRMEEVKSGSPSIKAAPMRNSLISFTPGRVGVTMSRWFLQLKQNELQLKDTYRIDNAMC